MTPLLPYAIPMGGLDDLARLESELAKSVTGCGGGRRVSTRDDEDEGVAGMTVDYDDTA